VGGGEGPRQNTGTGSGSGSGTTGNCYKVGERPLLP